MVMKARKINLDRAPISSDKIKSKQDFEHVVTNYKLIKPSFWTNPWFYGPVGLASFAIVVSLMMNNLNSNPEQNEKKFTLVKPVLPEDTKCIHPPLKNKDVTFSSFVIDPTKNEKITLESGTTVAIPKGSLISKTDEKIQLKIREFDSKSDAFVAGIPMDLGEKEAFESAGMIEIRALQKGKEIEISTQKPIQVEMVLNQNPTGFDFWRLNEEKKDWEKYPSTFTFPSSSSSSLNSSKTDKIKELEKDIIVVDTKLNELIVPLKKDFLLPEKGIQRFDIDFNEKDYPELEKLRDIEFEVDTKNKYDRNFTKKAWENMDLSKKENGYIITFSNSKEKFQIPVRPILKGIQKDKAEQKFDSHYEAYLTKKVELQTEKDKLFAEKTALIQFNDLDVPTKVDLNSNSLQSVKGYKTTFSTTVFGVFNCDKPITYPKATEEEFAYTFQNNQLIKTFQVYVFDKVKNVRYSYGQGFSHPVSQVGFHAKNESVLLIIDQNGDIGYLTNFNAAKSNNGQLKVTRLDEKDVNLQSIQKLIDESSIDA
jgi:hypothetical protein